MTKKEMTIKLLLTTNKSYKIIASEINSTEKSIAFYAHQLRKIDEKCLDHRRVTKSEKIEDLLKKYQ